VVSGRGVGALLRRLRLTRNAAGPVAVIAVSPPFGEKSSRGSVPPRDNRACRQADRRSHWLVCSAFRRLETTVAFVERSSDQRSGDTLA
jgi:hypothetical protein